MSKKYGQFEQVNGGTVNDLVVELEAIKEQNSARIAELEKEAERRSQLATPSDFNREQLKFANATIEELEKKLAAYQAKLWRATRFVPTSDEVAERDNFEELQLQLSTARAEERAKVTKEVYENDEEMSAMLSEAKQEGYDKAMKEVSETPVVAYCCMETWQGKLRVRQWTDVRYKQDEVYHTALIVRPTFKE
jgi:hypothetical protein